MTGSQSATIAQMQKALQASPVSQEPKDQIMGEGIRGEVDPIVMKGLNDLPM